MRLCAPVHSDHEKFCRLLHKRHVPVRACVCERERENQPASIPCTAEIRWIGSPVSFQAVDDLHLDSS